MVTISTNQGAEANTIFNNFLKENEMNKKQFCDKLAHYAAREPKQFLQLDGFHKPKDCEGLMRGLEGDDLYMAGGTVELMRGASVRILIPYDTDVKVAIRQIKRMARWLKNNPELIEYAKPNADAELNPSPIDFELPF